MKGKRTISFAIFVIVVGILVASSELIQTWIDAWAFGVILVCVGIVVGALRFMTDTPVWKADSEN